MMKIANHLTALLRKLVPNTSTSQQMQKTTEQLDAETKRFVIRAFSLALVFIVILFGYSIVFTEQPLFNEAPADKQIFTVLTLIGGQLLTILANYISKTSTPLTPPTIPTTTCSSINNPITPKTFTPTTSPHFGNPNDRPAL